MGLPAYYSSWISHLSDEIRPLVFLFLWSFVSRQRQSRKKSQDLLLYLLMSLYLLLWRMTLSFPGLYHPVIGVTQRLRKKLTLLSLPSRFEIYHYHRLEIGVKNGKTQRWRVEPPCYTSGVIYGLVKDNIVADTLSHVCCASPRNPPNLQEPDSFLCASDVTRTLYFICPKNLSLHKENKIRNISLHCVHRIKTNIFKSIMDP